MLITQKQLRNLKTVKRKKIGARELRKKKSGYFKRSSIVKKGRRRRETIKYIVERTYESLPQYLKKYLDEDGNKESIVENLTNMITVYKNQDFDPFTTLAQMAIYKRRRSYIGTREDLWERLKMEYHGIYLDYVKIMRNRGITSPKQYFIENIELKIHKSIVEGKLDLLIGAQHRLSVDAEVLEVSLNYSGEEFTAAMY